MGRTRQPHTGYVLKHLWTIGELVSLKPYPAPKWLIKGWLPGGGWVLCFSKPKIGKSLLVAQMLHALAVGGPFFSRQPQPMPCVMIQGDTPMPLWQEELAQAGLPADSPVHIFEARPGALSGGLDPIMAELRPLRPCYVAFDAIDSLFVGLNINEVEPAKEVLRRLRHVAGGPAFLAIHHARKGSPGEQEDLRDAAAGSRVLMEQADQVVYLRGPEGPIEITGRLTSAVYKSQHLRRTEGGLWAWSEPKRPSLASASP